MGIRGITGNKQSNDNNNDNKKLDEDSETIRRNEVKKEFTTKFKKIIAKYIPPKIIFKGNISKRSLITKKFLSSKYGASNLILFGKYILLTE